MAGGATAEDAARAGLSPPSRPFLRTWEDALATASGRGWPRCSAGSDPSCPPLPVHSTFYGEKRGSTLRPEGSAGMHSSVLFLTASPFFPKEEESTLLMSPERRKFLELRPAHQRVVVLGLKSGEQAQPLSCSRGPSALRPVAPGVPRLCGGGYRSVCHKPDRPLSSRARCLPPGLLLHL